MTTARRREAISSRGVCTRRSVACWQRALIALVALLVSGACRESARRAPAEAASAAPPSSPQPASRGGGADRLETFSERRLEPDPLRDLAPPDAPRQRIAFSKGRLAWLEGGELRVISLSDFAPVTRFSTPGARNVVGLTGGGFLVATDEHLLRLSALERRPEVLPRAPRIGPTLIIPSRIESQQFWLYYSGITELPRFDLGGPPRVALLPIVEWTALVEFDRRALLGPGDGSFVYTTAEGLRRIDVEGRPERLPHAELAGQVWALGRDRRLDRVWAATERHLYLVHVRGQAEVQRRFELGAPPMALAAEEGTVAVLRAERVEPSAVRAVVDVYVDGQGPPQVLRLDAEVGAPGDAGSAPRFEPELGLSVADGLVAVWGFGLQVHDYRRGVRVYPGGASAQKLAPGAR